MKKEFTYKILRGKEIEDNLENILDYFDPERKRPEDIKKSFTNSQFVVAALSGNKIIGTNQVISDLYYAAFFINLYVDPAYRKEGIGKEIFKLTLEEAKKLKVKNIMLTSDINHPWLQDFYRGLGFRSGEEHGVYMYYR